MAFDLDKFNGAELGRRTDDVDVPGLAPFFEKNEPPVWTVRGLTGEELARAQEAVSRSETLEAVAQALSQKGEGKVEAIRTLLGVSCSVPDDLAKRIDMLVSGSVKPEIDRPTAVRLAENFPIEFYLLTNRITRLTGMGSEVGKPKRSTAKRTSSST